MLLKKSFTAFSTSCGRTDSAAGGVLAADTAEVAGLSDAGGSLALAVGCLAAEDVAAGGPEAAEPPFPNGSTAQTTMRPARTIATRAAAIHKARPRRRPGSR